MIIHIYFILGEKVISYLTNFSRNWIDLNWLKWIWWQLLGYLNIDYCFIWIYEFYTGLTNWITKLQTNFNSFLPSEVTHFTNVSGSEQLNSVHNTGTTYIILPSTLRYLQFETTELSYQYWNYDILLLRYIIYGSFTILAEVFWTLLNHGVVLSNGGSM